MGGRSEKSRSLRTFYILLLTQMLSLIGSDMTALAISIEVYQDTDRVTPLAFVSFFSMLTKVLSASFAGVLADRWDRRKVMAIGDAGQAAATLILLVSFATGTFTLGLLYVTVVIEAAFVSFQMPAVQSIVTMLVPDEQRDRANSLQLMVGPAAGLVAPVLAGVLFTVIGVTGVMALDLATFAVAVGVVLAVHIPHPEQSAEAAALQPGRVWQEALVGFRYLWSRRMLFWLGFAATLANFLLVGALVLNTPYILTLTDDNEALLGTLLGVVSLGPLAGGLIMSAWGGTRPRIHMILPGIMLEGVFLALYGLSRHPVTLGAALIMALFPMPFVNAGYMSIFQVKVPPDLQGRVFAALNQVTMLLTPLGYVLAGPLADHVFEPAVGGAGWDMVEPLVGARAGSGMGLMMVVYGALMAVSMAAMYAWPAMHHMEATLPDYDPVAAEEPAEAGEQDESPVEGDLAPVT